MVRSGGVLACVDADNGKLLYRDRLGGLGQYSASPVIASGHLYLVSEPGILSVVKADDSFKVTHQYDLAEEVVTTPAIDPRYYIYPYEETALGVPTGINSVSILM